MVKEGKARLFKRKDGKYLIYVPLDVATDSMFPFGNFVKTRRGSESVPLKMTFDHTKKKLLFEEWKEPDDTANLTD